MERRTIEELEVQYGLEPLLRDVFVEGSSDAQIARWFIHENGSVARVFEIQDIAVPREVVERHGLPTGNRGRVVALALELEARLGEDQECATFIADRDNPGRMSPLQRSSGLLFTDFRDMEAYFCSSEVLNKLLLLVARNCPLRAEDVLTAVTSALVDLGIIHAAIDLLDQGIGWLPKAVTDCLELKGNVLALDVGDLVHRLLTSSSSSVFRERLLELVATLRKAVGTEEARIWIRGHDFVVVLAWHLEAYLPKGLVRAPDAFEAALRATLELGHVEGFPLFRKLLGRVL